jgi:hypothetical protein
MFAIPPAIALGQNETAANLLTLAALHSIKS